MNRWMTRICTAGLLAGLSLGLGSCAHNDDMLVILGTMSAQPPDCTFEPSSSAKLLLTGIVDRAFGVNLMPKYTAVLLVANQLASRGSKNRLRAETSNITVNNAEVRLLAGGETAIGYYSVPASGYIQVGSGEDSGYGVIAIDVLPGTIAVPTGFVIAEIRLQGTTLGGADVESNLFRFEIFVVDSNQGNGLVYYPDVLGNKCDCSTATNTTAASCFPGQDSYIPCCSCQQYKFCNTVPGLAP